MQHDRTVQTADCDPGAGGCYLFPAEGMPEDLANDPAGLLSHGGQAGSRRSEKGKAKASAKVVKSTIFATREEWLVALTEKLRLFFTDCGLGLEIPAVRVSCSWPSKMIRKRLGECWHSKAAKDGSRQIFVTPLLDKGFEVAEVMVHELLHAALPDGAGHKAPFKKGMKSLGLEGKPTATYAGEELTERLHALCNDLDEYPHQALRLTDMAGKKQGTRMLKLTCPSCGYTLRTTQKWLDEGLPTCHCGEDFIQETA